MLLIVGKKNCSRCITVRQILDNAYKQYKYILIEDCSDEERDRYYQLAKRENQNFFPLIIKDNNIITLQEV